MKKYIAPVCECVALEVCGILALSALGPDGDHNPLSRENEQLPEQESEDKSIWGNTMWD